MTEDNKKTFMVIIILAHPVYHVQPVSASFLGKKSSIYDLFLPSIQDE